MRCDLSRLLVRKITKRFHSSKAASLNRPITNTVDIFGSGIHWYGSRSKRESSRSFSPELLVKEKEGEKALDLSLSELVKEWVKER